MEHTDLSINELSQQERRFVLRTLFHAIGADTALNALAKSKRRVEYEDLLRALNSLPAWPTPASHSYRISVDVCISL